MMLFALFMAACGGGTEQKAEEVSSEQETEIVDAINSDLEEAQQELETETEESLNEIDSLLQNVE